MIETSHLQHPTYHTRFFIFYFPDMELDGRIKIKAESGFGGVAGVTWLENKIYVVCWESNRIFVFSDQKPFDRLEKDEIEIKEMKNPWDITASRGRRSIFISDWDEASKCLWKIQMEDKQVSRWKMDGSPYGLSITSSDELLVVVWESDGRDYLYIYRSSDVCRLKRISFPMKIKDAFHAVQSSNGNYIILYGTGEWIESDEEENAFEGGKVIKRKKRRRSVNLVSEMTVDGSIVRTFNPSSFESIPSKWNPRHLSIDSDDNIFIADVKGDRVFLLNSQLTDLQILLTKDRHRIVRPSSLCYLREKQQLIVGEDGSVGNDGETVSIWNLRPTTTDDRQGQS